MQRSNRFFYDIAVSRVQLKLCVLVEPYFVVTELVKFSHNIFRINKNALSVDCITNAGLNFRPLVNTAQLGHELYCYALRAV